MDKVKVGLIGCGNISKAYLNNCTKYNNLQVIACADLDLARAQERATEYGVPIACTPAELLANKDIEIVINLTIPKAHAEVCLQALEAGKHVYTEKPFTVTREEGLSILKKAKEKGLLVASAPETFMGGGIQTCRKLIDEGWIGTPVAASAFMMGGGHEGWHPDPEFYYEVGGGPMFDMGPYYITALVTLLGPIQRVTGSTRISFPERTIRSEKKFGKKITVETPTHVTGILEFTSGAVGTIITSFDVFGGHRLPTIEIYGSLGTLSVPDPNTFGGPVLLRRFNEKEWREIPLTHGYTDNNRGIGVMDMAFAIRNERTHRAHGDMAYHVLEAMHAFHDSAAEGRHYMMKSTCERPAAMPELSLDAGLVR
ncbi:MAG: Gfo/Idh/MocA family oxidoreductase [Paenibacillaceae bacterium]